MSEVGSWLGHRRPSPPPDLGAELHRGVGPGAPQDSLLAAAILRLDAARARPGRVRASAFDLLIADALTTYACEAALESPDPESALMKLLEVGAVR